MEYGICHLGILPVRNENRHAGELVTQLIYGDAYKILETQKKWVRIRIADDGYEGWLHALQVHKISKSEFEANQKLPNHFTSDLVNYLTNKEGLLFPIPIGSNLKANTLLEHQFEDQQKKAAPQKDDLVKTAYLYLNTPYLWGGKTPFGIDCSGLVQMVYKINGRQLLRDASEQATQGTTLSFIEESAPGDLAFFDNKEGDIIHVGMLLENHHIIHAHGHVRIDRIDQTGIYNAEQQTHSHKLRLIKNIWE